MSDDARWVERASLWEEILVPDKLESERSQLTNK